ncbi:MAG: NADH-quinone oxidoreductase subunit NuoE [Acidobacteriota bacterium]
MLSAEERADLDELRGHYPTARAASVTILKWLQQRRGYLSTETLGDAADYLGVPMADLEGLATFYNLLYRRPVGERVILLCDSASCWIRGCDRIRAQLQERLGIRMGETTADGRFTLLPTVCLGDCDHAPAMLVGGELHHDLAVEELDRILQLEGLGQAREREEEKERARGQAAPADGGESG